MLNAVRFDHAKMPKAITCYICGRGYGTKSIKIHLKNCEKKWDIDQQQKSKKDRRPCPKPPSNFLEIIYKDKISHDDVQKINNIAFEEYNEVSLEKCPFCFRTFNFESMAKHRNLCTADKPFKRVLREKANIEDNAVDGLKRRSLVEKTIALPPILTPKTNEQKIKNRTSFQAKENVSRSIGAKEIAGLSNRLSVANTYSSSYNRNSNEDVEKYNRQQFVIKKNKEDYSTRGEFLQKKNSSQEINSPAFSKSKTNEEFSNVETTECGKCGRNFIIDRIAKHEKICKGDTKPSKVVKFHEKKEEINTSKSSSNWKQQHEELIANMRYMRKLKAIEQRGGDIRTVEPPPRAANNDYKICSFCNRKFGPEVIDRHVRICKTVINKPKGVPR